MNSDCKSKYKQVLYNQLKKLYEAKKIVSIFTNEGDTDKFSAGILYDVSDCSVIMAHISPEGLYDGYIVIQIKDIYSIEYDGAYEKKISILYDIQKQKHKKIDNYTNNSIMNMLQFAFLQKYVVTIELFDSQLDDAQGLIENINQEVITLRLIDKYGKVDGYKLINSDDIAWMFCDTSTEISLRLLYNYYNAFEDTEILKS